MALGLLLPTAAHCAPASLKITQDMPLRFGSFAVFGTGSRTVQASGAVSNVNIYPVTSVPTGPGQFTVTYDRGNANRKEISIRFMLMLGQVAPVNQAGVNGTLANFESDLAGAPALMPGRLVMQTMPNCVTRTCSVTFRIGARIDVTRASGGAALVVPIPVTAILVSVQNL